MFALHFKRLAYINVHEGEFNVQRNLYSLLTLINIAKYLHPFAKLVAITWSNINMGAGI